MNVLLRVSGKELFLFFPQVCARVSYKSVCTRVSYTSSQNDNVSQTKQLEVRRHRCAHRGAEHQTAPISKRNRFKFSRSFKDSKSKRPLKVEANMEYVALKHGTASCLVSLGLSQGQFAFFCDQAWGKVRNLFSNTCFPTLSSIYIIYVHIYLYTRTSGYVCIHCQPVTLKRDEVHSHTHTHPACDCLQPTRDGLQSSSSDGLQPSRDGLQSSSSDGLQPTSHGLQTNSDGLPEAAVHGCYCHCLFFWLTWLRTVSKLGCMNPAAPHG